MKIKVSLIFDVLRYWVANGKTTTALIAGLVTIVLKDAGLEQFAPDATELAVALFTSGTLGLIGVWHKILKFIEAKKAEQDAADEK